MINAAKKYGLNGLSITDHESLSGHYKAQQMCKDDYDFKLILGNEIYLLTPEEDQAMRNGERDLKFPHFILQALDAEGHYQLRQLSSRAWKRSYIGKGIVRRPTLTTDIEEIIGKNKGHIIGHSSCLGSLFSQLVLELIKREESNDTVDEVKIKIHEFLQWCIKVFGSENFFIEIQPATEIQEDQIKYNYRAIEIAKAYGIDFIATTDSHYLGEHQRLAHTAFLNSKDGDREVDTFYSTAYLMSKQELTNYLKDHLDEEDIKTAISNTNKIGKRVKKYDLSHEIIIPKIDLPEFTVRHTFKDYYDKYKYLYKFAYSKNEQDKYLIYQIEKGMEQKILKDDYNEALNRINIELKEFYEITQVNGLEFSSYYNTMAKIIELTWTEGDSLVGAGRGSAGAYLLCYLLDITQINPIPLGDLMPHWRHLSKERGIDPPDIDFDTEGSKRKRIINVMKKYFGDNRVLQVCTFGTLSAKTAIQLGGKGLGYSNDDMDYLKSLIPIERGLVWGLRDCLYGNEEKGRDPVKILVNEIEKYPNLKEVALELENLIVSRGQHASGVLILNDDFTKYNACMTSPSGDLTTQFDLHDSEAMSAIKYDFLTINALDKIRTCMDLLIKEGYIQYQGTLKKTYDRYLHPSVIDYDTMDMWRRINKISDIFQFDSAVGMQAIEKVKPTHIIDLSTSNSLMRLMGDGQITPLDLYVRYKNDIEEWFMDMKEYGLNEEEIEILKKHLMTSYGLADSQEKVMLMAMDKSIANFTLMESNTLRRSIAKKDEKILKKAKNIFFESGLEAGTRQAMLDYVWNVVFAMSFGYSFSSVHSYEYSVIAVQELNLACKYPQVYWETACLTINAGADEDNKDNKSTDYGRVASAIGNIQSRGFKLSLPNISTADFGFRPDESTNSIVFGLKGIHGIGDDIVFEIIKNRPYKSFDDFLNRLVFIEDSIVKQSHVIQLIKCGAFDSIQNDNREQLMKKYINIISEPKLNLNMQNFNTILNYGLVPEDLSEVARFFRFRKYIYSKKPYKVITNNNSKIKRKIDDEWYLLDDISTEFYLENFSENSIVDYIEANLVISKKKFDKEYNEKIEPLRELLRKKDTLNKLNQKLFEDTWNRYACGNISKWEMDTLCFYYHEHELINVNKELYGVSNFFDLPEEPIIVGYNAYRNRKTPKYKVDRIMGTILDRDKNKHTVSLLTVDGVVNVKLYAGAFAHYDKQISRINNDGTKTVIESSWFKRGSLAIFTGFRRGDRFVPRVYRDTIYQHTVCLIERVKDNGELLLKTEREVA